MQVPVFSVSQFLDSINQTLEYAYPVVQVEGEVSSFKVNQNKYIFFDLKDQTGTVNCFASIWQLKTPLEDGMKVLITARAKVTPWGKFSLTVQAVKPVGDGTIKRSQELLKAKLDKEGLFDPDRKRPLPVSPARIAVISSTGAAGYADFIKILSQRTGGVAVDVAQVQVQGEAAAAQIVRAIEYLNGRSELADVLVLIRGGGSLDDLSAWSDERVVRAIAGSRIPTLVGIGHETDITLSDLAADVRAATPSNAAQIVVTDRRELINANWRSVERVQEKTRLELKALADKLLQSIKTVQQVVLRSIGEQRVNLNHTKSTLELYNPQLVLERGYALLRGKMAVGELIEIETANKQVSAEVKNVRSKN